MNTAIEHIAYFWITSGYQLIDENLHFKVSSGIDRARKLIDVREQSSFMNDPLSPDAICAPKEGPKEVRRKVVNAVSRQSST